MPRGVPGGDDGPMLTWTRVVLIVVGCALGGMVLGGLFGVLAGNLAPEAFFLTHWDMEGQMQKTGDPVLLASLLGATGGLFLGGGLGVFAVTVHAWVSGRRGPTASPHVPPPLAVLPASPASPASPPRDGA
ncbi:MAG: hypothetical protein HMLKMBBP_03132 [Planctomycetes bacterium]|nr:hypothetical protein [Planctomycetota bacterium]